MRTRGKKRSYKECESDEEFKVGDDSDDKEGGDQGLAPSDKRSRHVGFGTWRSNETLLIFEHQNQKTSNKIAAFDFDDTLVRTKSGKSFAISANDWQHWHPSKVTEKLKKVHSEGFKVVIFTNQGGISKGHVSEAAIKQRITSFIESVNIPIQVLAATGTDHFRKPSIAMWQYLLSHLNDKVTEVDMKSSFYVGDAAGRPKDWKPKKKKDHSCADRQFALNVGINFYTPEEYFLDEKRCEQFNLGFDPKIELKTNTKSFKDSDIISKDQELVIFVGYPGCGKSTFAKRYFIPHDYVRVNRDTLKTIAKCKKLAEESLADKKSVIIDNTNPDKETRAEYLHLAKKYKIKARCFWFKTSEELSSHLNRVREVISKGQTPHVPMVAYRSFKKKFQKPQVSEGFDEVKEIDFVPEFESLEGDGNVDQLKTVLYQYLG